MRVFIEEILTFLKSIITCAYTVRYKKRERRRKKKKKKKKKAKKKRSNGTVTRYVVWPFSA